MDARRWVLRGTPIAFGLLSLVHPLPRGRPIVDALQPSLGRWLAVHVIQLALLGLLASTVWLLVEGCPTRAALVSRLALIPFLAFYSAFDAIVGIGTGTLVGLARGLEDPARATAAQLAQAFWDARLTPGTPVSLVVGVAITSWLVAAGAAAVALHRAGARRAVVVLVALAGVLFAIDHPFPTGTAAMACLGAATWLHPGPPA
jgi:hypothetical protein